MPGHIPGRRDDRWYDKKTILEALTVVPPIIIAIVGAASSWADPAKRAFAPWLIVAAVWLAVGSTGKVLHAYAQDREKKRTEQYEGFLGALHVLHSVVAARAGLTSTRDAKLRTTIHRVVPGRTKKRGPEQLEQLLPYLGGERDGAGRLFDVRSGIIGKAVREGSSFVASRKSVEYEDFVHELVREWSYTRDDARQLRADRWSWMAVPVTGRGGVVAVVYLDSSIEDFFTPEIQGLVLDACGGIAAFTIDAY